MNEERGTTKEQPKAKKASKLIKAIRCVVFLGLLGFLVLHISYIVRQAKWRYSKGTFPAFYAEEKDSLDVVTIGSSADYQFFDTPYLYEEFGITSFNLSVPLQPSTATVYLMNEVEKSQSPELYVVEARRYIRSNSKNWIRALYLLSDSMDLNLNKWQMLRHSYDSVVKCIHEFLDLWKYHSFWTNVGRSELAYWDNRVANPSKTWRNREEVEPQKTPKRFENLESEPLQEENVRELTFLLEECKKKGRKVLFVMTPLVYNRSFQRRMITFREMVESYGFDFLDLTDGESYGLDYGTDFWDFKHVNYKGAEKVTKVLGEYIEKEYNIHAQHTDKVTADWERCAAENREIVNKIEAKNKE